MHMHAGLPPTKALISFHYILLLKGFCITKKESGESSVTKDFVKYDPRGKVWNKTEVVLRQWPVGVLWSINFKGNGNKWKGSSVQKVEFYKI